MGLGPEFSFLASNQTLAKVIEQYTSDKFSGPRANRRPDLLLVNQPSRHYTLIEFKRPSRTIDRQDINQAEQYRDDLSSRFEPIDVLVIGGQHDTRMDRHPPQNVRILSYSGVVSRARSELQWLLSNWPARPKPSVSAVIRNDRRSNLAPQPALVHP